MNAATIFKTLATDGEYRDIAHPINSETRDKIQKVILDKYETTALEN